VEAMSGTVRAALVSSLAGSLLGDATIDAGSSSGNRRWFQPWPGCRISGRYQREREKEREHVRERKMRAKGVGKCRSVETYEQRARRGRLLGVKNSDLILAIHSI